MPLKFKIPATEHVTLDPTVQKLYKEAGDAFQLDVDGAVDAGVEAKLSEFRESNRTLNGSVLALQKQLDAAQPLLTEHAALKAKAAEFEKRGATKPDDIAALIEQGITKATEPLRTQLGALSTTLQEKDRQLAETERRAMLRRVADDHNVDANMFDEFVGNMTPFRLVDGRLAARKDDGAIFSDPDDATGNTPLMLDKHLSTLRTRKPGLFKASAGAGSQHPSNSHGTPAKVIGVDQMSGSLEDIAKGKTTVQGFNG